MEEKLSFINFYLLPSKLVTVRPQQVSPVQSFNDKMTYDTFTLL